MRTGRFIACVAAAVLSTRWTTGDEFASLGKVKVKADSPLVRAEYPRLLITRAQLPAIRARLRHPEIQACVREAQDLIRIKKAAPLLLGALYQVTGDRRYAEQAKEGLGEPDWDPAWSFTFDLLADTMTEAERKGFARKMLAHIEANRWRPRLLLALAAWGNGLDAELIPYVEAGHAQEVDATLGYCNRWTRGRGGSSMGHGYNGEHFFSVEFANMIGWSNATGEDLVSKSDFARQQPAWYVYHYLPWQKFREVIRIGVTMETASTHTVMPATFQGESYVLLAITQARDGLGQWWHREYMGNFPMPHWRKGEEHIYGLAGRLLWLDPSIPSIPPEKFPETRLFPENGHVAMRSGWDEHATLALFRCGRFGTIDGAWGRNNADNLHFIIYRNGYLTPDTGCVHSGNEYLWKMVPDSNLYNYGRQTIAHNSITVGRERITHYGWQKKVLGECLRGGQTKVQEPEYFKAWGTSAEEQRDFREGGIAAYETSPEFDYACGDATHSYPPARVKSITRQFVYLKPGIFVVFDRVQPADPALEVIWNYHTPGEPAWNGRRAADPAWPPERQFVVSTDGRKVPNPHPGGHFLCTRGNTFRFAAGGGEASLKTLLPEGDGRVVRVIGGPWHDFEVDGVNYGPTEETYQLLERRKGLDPLMGVGGWRIEVSPAETGGEVRFLHVLEVADRGRLEPADVSLVRRGGRTGAKISTGARAFEVTFNTEGPTGGHIRIDQPQAAIDRELAASVEDNYDRWKADPRYGEWMSSEYMRAVIFPYGVKPQ